MMGKGYNYRTILSKAKIIRYNLISILFDLVIKQFSLLKTTQRPTCTTQGSRDEKAPGRVVWSLMVPHVGNIASITDNPMLKRYLHASP